MEICSFRSVLVLSGLLVLPLSAQDPIRGPMLGWVWDSRQESIRPILGIAGSSVLGTAADLGFAVKFASISGNQEYAFALGGDTREAMAVDLRPVTPTFTRIDGVPHGATRTALSPRGNAAVLWYTETNKLAILGGLPREGVLLREIDLSVEGPPGAIAVNDDGSLVLASFPETKSVMVFDADGNRWKLPKESAVTALVFVDNSRDALLAAEDGVFLTSDVSSNATFRSISTIASASALAALDAGRVLVVDGSVQAVVEVTVDSGDSRSVQCPCAPTGLVRMSGSGIFRLNEVSRGPLWLVEISDSGLRTVFVPPDPSDPELEE
jgi:hypothetical protein